MKFHKLLITLLLALIPAAMASTTWYADGVSGSDGNDCKSPATACKTIGHAISLASSGDSIRVAAATYTENLTIGISLTIVGSGAAKTTVDGGGVGTVFRISSGVNVALSKLTVRNGYALSGGGIANSGTLTMNRSVVTANVAHKDCGSPTCGNNGGGIQNSGTLTLNNSSVLRNTVSITSDGGYTTCQSSCSSDGGGIWNSGTLVINSSTVSGNSASISYCSRGHCDADGGGIFNHYATVTITQSTISGNKSRYSGGIENFGTLTLTNSTLSGNIGGGISSGNAGTLLINSSTVNGNSYGWGINLFNDGTVALQNSIVANNLTNDTPENCYGSITSNGYNLSSDGTCNFNAPGDMNNTDPQLGPLQNNGGPTKTMALPSGSPAIDAGNPKGCTDSLGNLLKTDQRGKPRPDPEDLGGCDIGAYESQSD